MAELTQEQRTRLEAIRQSPDITDEQRARIDRIFGAAGPVDPRPAGLKEATAGFVDRPAFTAAGGMLGAVVGGTGGLAAGPGAPAAVPAGAITGGALGAAGGSLVFDSIEGAARELGLFQPKEVGTFEPAMTAVKEGTVDAAFGMGASVVRPILGLRSLLGKITGVTTEESTKLASLLRSQGIDPSVVQVGNTIPKAFARTIGIFPFTGTPLRKAVKTARGQVESQLGRLLDNLAPHATISSEIGEGMTAAARNTSLTFRKTAGRLYDNFRTLAKNASVKEIIPTQNIKELATAISENEDLGRIVLTNGEELPKSLDNVVNNFIVKLKDLPEVVTIEQYRRLTNDFGDILNQLAKEGVDVRNATLGKKALESDLNNIRVDLLGPDEGKKIVDALKRANKFYAEGIAKFQTPTGKRVTRVDQTIFGPGAPQPGTLNADELERVAVNLKSPQAINDLRSLVGDDLMNQSARLRVERAANDSFDLVQVGEVKERLFNPLKFQQALGLGGRSKVDREALDAFLKGSGVNLRDLEEFIEASSKIQDFGDPSQFIRRRAILGGVSGALGGAVGASGGLTGAAAGGAGGLFTFALGGLIARHGNKIVADPAKLKLILAATDTANKQVLRQAAFGRLVNNIVQELQNETARRQEEREANRPIDESAIETGS